MKAIKLWKIQENEPSQLKVEPIQTIEQTKTEDQLEEVITRYPAILMEDLTLIGRQTETSGGALDLLGVDGDGRIVIFELKRGTLSREAVAQVIDYASYLAELEIEELSKHISEKSGKLGIEKIESFSLWYQEHYGESLTWPQKPRLVLVGLGVDDRTRRMVEFLADSDIDVSLITFHGFSEGGDVILARHVEVESKSTDKTTAANKMSNLEKLKERVLKIGVAEYYYKVAEFFRTQLGAYEWPNPGGFSYYLPELTSTGRESNRVYLALYIYENRPGRFEIRLHPRAIEAGSDLLESFKEQLANRITMRNDGAAEVWLKSANDWEKVKKAFEGLCPKIVEGWKRKREQKSQEEFETLAEETEVAENLEPTKD